LFFFPRLRVRKEAWLAYKVGIVSNSFAFIGLLNYSLYNLRDMTNTELSPFVSQTLVYLISLPPSSLNNIKGGIVASLHTSVLKYDPRLPGVLISFKDISFTRDKCIGTILNENR